MVGDPSETRLSRVWLGFGILGFAALLIAAVSILSLLSLADRKRELVAHVKQISDAGQLHLVVEKTIAAKRALLLTGESRYLEEMQDGREVLHLQIDSMQRRAESAEERSLLDRLPRLEIEHQAAFERAQKMQADGTPREEFIRFFDQELEPRRSALSEAAREYIVFLQARQAYLEAEADRAALTAVLVVAGTTLFTILLAAGLATGVGRRLLRSQRFLAQNRERLNNILQSAMDAIITIGEDQRIILFNEAAERIFRISAQRALGEHIDRFVPERFRRGHASQVEKFGTTGVTSRTMGRLGTLYGLRSDGEEFPLEATISQTHAGGAKFYTVILRDITERLAAEEALRYQSQLTQTITDSVSIALFLLDADGKPNFMNPAAHRLTGFGLEELRSISFGEALQLSPAWSEAVREMKPLRNHEDTLHRKDRTRAPVLLTLEPIRREGKALGAVAEILDLSERRKTEAALQESEEKLQQSQKMEAVGQLAGGIAHDFNNLLTAINGYTELCLSLTEERSPIHEHLTEVRQAGQRAAELTSQLLAYSRKQVVLPRVLNLNQVVDNISRLLKRLIGENIVLTLDLEPALGLIKVDSGQLEQIIVNLSLNARDSMPQGGDLTIETLNTDFPDHHAGIVMDTEPGSYVALLVKDTGSGIPPEVKPHIFEPFFTTKGVGKGTGLGLASTYGIVKQAGGTIVVESQPGQGTVFKVLFPRIQDAEEGAAQQAGRARKANVRGKGETILLVEDEATVRHFTRKVLESLGYMVLEAGDGREGIQVFLANAADIRLLLSDVVMPGMSGPDMAEELRRHKPDLKVLFMSGYTQESAERLESSMAGQNLLRKPFSPSQLGEKVKDALAVSATA